MSEQVKRYFTEMAIYPEQLPIESVKDCFVVLAEDHDAAIKATHAEAEALRAENGRLRETERALIHNHNLHVEKLAVVRGLLRELIGAVRTINHGPQHKIMVKGDDQPRYWQRQEWVVYLLNICNEAEESLTAIPAPEVPVVNQQFTAEQGERQEAVAWSLRLPDGRTTLEKAYPKWAEGEGDGYAIQPLYTTPQPSPDVRGLVSADDVRDACANAVSVFAEETNANQCREVAEYMREVLLAQIAKQQAQRNA